LKIWKSCFIVADLKSSSKVWHKPQLEFAPSHDPILWSVFPPHTCAIFAEAPTHCAIATAMGGKKTQNRRTPLKVLKSFFFLLTSKVAQKFGTNPSLNLLS
jgi:hypothetical protein